MRLSLVGAAATSCVKIPPFQPQDAGEHGDGGTEPQMVTVVEDATGEVHVTAPGYTMRFSRDGARFPDRFDVGGEQRLGNANECADEQGMGIALRPVYRANGDPATVQSAISLPLVGPHVGQVSIEWQANVVCGGTINKLDGRSTFSFFPDGRLTRFDLLTSSATVNASTCDACGVPASSFFLGSYTTLTVDADADLYPTMVDLENYGQEQASGKTVCVRQRDRSVAFAWVDSTARLRLVGTTPSRSIAFIKDLFGGISMPAGEWQTTTQMGVSASEDCGALVERIDPFTEPANVNINGTLVTAYSRAGIFGGDNGGLPVSFPVEIKVDETPSHAGTVPAGFAVWLSASAIPENVTLTHSAGHTGTSWYRLQRVGQRDLVVWFDVPLEVGETITILGT